MSGLWSAEQNANYRSRDEDRKPMWVLRYDPAPGGTKNADGTTTYQMNFPALQLTEWVAEPEKVAANVATILNAHADLEAALTEAKEALSYAMRGTSDAEQSDKYAATIARIDAALGKAGA